MTIYINEYVNIVDESEKVYTVEVGGYRYNQLMKMYEYDVIKTDPNIPFKKVFSDEIIEK